MKSITSFISFLAFVWLGLTFNPQTVKADFGSAIPDGSTIIAEGDSITAGYHLAVGEDWPSVLMTTPNFTGKGTLSNFSVSSSEVNWLWGRYESKVYPLRPQNGEPAILFVWAGTNDILVTDQSAEDVYTELANYWQRAKDDGFEVWAFTIIERSNFNASEREQAQELNRLIRESTVWDRLVDIAPLFSNPLNPALYLDGIHPTSLGSIKIAQFVNDLASTQTSYTQASAQTLSIQQLFASGNVGIGTIAPVITGGIGQHVKSDTNAGIKLESNAAAYELLSVGTSGDFGLYDTTRAAYRIYVRSDGKVGFGGNTAPLEAVDVTGNIKASGKLLSSGLTVQTATTSATARIVGDGQASGVMIDRFVPNVNSGVLQLRKARGKVNTPGEVLKGDTMGGISFWGYQNGGFQLGSYITSGVDASPVGKTVPSNFKFYTTNTEGKLTLGLNIDNAGAVSMPTVYSTAVSSARDVQIDATGKLGYVASSARYKEDVADLTSTDWLYNLRPVSFTYTADRTNTVQFGLIAEEVERVAKSSYPDLLSYSATDPKQVETVNYSKLIVPLLNETQQLNDRVSALEAVASGTSAISAHSQRVLVSALGIAADDIVAIYPIYNERVIKQVGAVQLYRGEIRPGEGFYVHVAPSDLSEAMQFDWQIL